MSLATALPPEPVRPTPRIARAREALVEEVRLVSRRVSRGCPFALT